MLFVVNNLSTVLFSKDLIKSMLKTQDKMVFFGLQAFIKEYLIEYFNDNFFALSKDEVLDLYTIVA